MERPSRKTKVVNYSDFQDHDDDEDFASVKAPPSKKAKEDAKQRDHRKSLSKSSSQETDSQSSNKKRKSLDDKLCERDLEAALALSLLQTTNGKEDRSLSNKDAVIQPGGDEDADPSAPHLSNCSVNISLLGLDVITATDASGRTAPLATERRRSVALRDEDEDYQPKPTPDSESEEDFSDQAESEDEEFTVKKVNKRSKKDKRAKNDPNKQPPVLKKEKIEEYQPKLTPDPESKQDKRAKNDPTKQPPVLKKEKQPSKEKQPTKPPKAKSQTTAVSTPARSPPVAKLAGTPKRPLTPTTTTTTTTFKPAVPLSPAAGKPPVWNPPGQIGKSPGSSQSVRVKSPGQGLRLGLSRRVRVKPLHPSVTSH